MELRDQGTGITRDSLRFVREHRHRLGSISEVTVRFPGYGDPYDPYLLTLTDDAGGRMLLSGCTSGYVGEGPNGTLQLLVAEGVPVELAIAVNDAAQVAFVRDDHGWRIDTYTNSHTPQPDDCSRGDDLTRGYSGRAR